MSLESGALGKQYIEKVVRKRVMSIADGYDRSRSSRRSPFIDLRCEGMHEGRGKNDTVHTGKDSCEGMHEGRGKSDTVHRGKDIGYSGRMAKEAPTRIRTGDRY
jgi:hypothetical protein